MLSTADGMVAYRTYPHVDMAETGAKSLALLETLFSVDKALFRSARRLPFLIPINGMCTLLEPARSAYARLAELEVGRIVSLSFTPGFPAADFPECGPVIWGYGDDETVVAAAVTELYDLIVGNEAAWQVPFLDPDEAVLEAMRLSASATKPVVIADTQDNPGAGADANTVGMLRALLRNGAREAAVGLFWDPLSAQAAHLAGIGATLELTLGGHTNIMDDIPLTADFEVAALSDGQCVYNGPMMHGMRTSLGLCACLTVEGVYVVVSSTKAQMFDRNLYRMAGIEPENMKILVNKSSVHFRADFEPIAHAVLVAKAPGPMTADPADLPWTRLAPGLRVAPGGRAFISASTEKHRTLA
jgi:microcystin degradation protein MlrC